MPISPDGILEATFDPARALVRLTVHDEWPDLVSSITITRTSPGVGTMPVRGVERRTVAGGVWAGSDNEAPLEQSVTYTATGHGSFGETVATSTVTVSTTGAAWGVWLKDPGEPSRTVVVPLRERAPAGSVTQGGIYQVLGGPAIPQWSGVEATTHTLTVLPRTTEQVSALEGLLTSARTLLVQTGQPEEIPSGYYQVGSVTQANPAQVLANVYTAREVTITLTATTVPVGAGVQFTGVTYETVRQEHATYQDVRGDNDTYFDVLMGAS